MILTQHCIAILLFRDNDVLPIYPETACTAARSGLHVEGLVLGNVAIGILPILKTGVDAPTSGWMKRDNSREP